MRSQQRHSIFASLAIFALITFGLAQAQTNAPDNKADATASPPLNVDKVVAHPEKCAGKIGVAGRVAKVDARENLFVLGCEDACVAMPVRFSGAQPKAGSDVIVRGQITKDAKGRYLFDAESVTTKK